MNETLDPSHQFVRRTILTRETLSQIRSEIERTGTGSMRLLRGAKDKPTGLTAQRVDTWLQGSVKSAAPEHVSYLLNRWAVLPTDRRMAFTPEMSDQLASAFRRTGMGPVTIIKKAQGVPDGLTRQVVQGWIDQATRSVSVRHWEYVLARLAALPDTSSPSSSHFARKARRDNISADDLVELKRHRDRTGIGGAILLRSADDKPPALSPAMISNWLSGVAKTADPEHVSYVLRRYRAWL